MNKQILSFVALSFLALAQPVTRTAAAPPNPSNSTEDADRKFLENLERADSAKAPATETAPAVTAGKSRETDRREPSKSATRRVVDVAISGDSEETFAPEVVAEADSTPEESPTKTTTITVVRPLNVDRAHHHHTGRRGILRRLIGNVLNW